MNDPLVCQLFCQEHGWLATYITVLPHPAYQRPSLGRPFRGVKLPGSLILKRVSRLDAFSGYLFRT